MGPRYQSKLLMLAAVALAAAPLAAKHDISGQNGESVSPVPADDVAPTPPAEPVQAQSTAGELRPRTVPAGADVAVIRVEGMIYDFVLTSMQRRIDRAVDKGATVIVVELNTPGGQVSSALKISKHLKSLQSPNLHTIAWVNNEAYSAGIMIAAACDRIVMAPFSATGDCAPIVMGKNLAPAERAKALSPILEEFRDSATTNGYDYAMFHAMCALGVELYLVEHTETARRMLVNQADYQVMVHGLTRDEALKAAEPKATEPTQFTVGETTMKVATRPIGQVTVEVATNEDRGKWELVKQVHEGATLLTVNQTRALEIGLSKDTVRNLDELQTSLNAASVSREEQSWSEHLVGWLVHPAVRAVLMLALMVGAYMEFQAPGLGLPGAVALIALVVLLVSPFLADLAEIWHVVVFFFGFILLMVELFVTPGFAILGSMGLIMMFTGLVLSIVPTTGDGPFSLPAPGTVNILVESLLWMMLSAIGGVLGLLVLIRHSGKVPGLYRLVLHASQPAGALATMSVSGDEAIGHGNVDVGATGRVMSELRPTGRAEIDGQLVDVVCMGQWIAIGTLVRVAEVHGNRIVVEPA